MFIEHGFFFGESASAPNAMWCMLLGYTRGGTRAHHHHLTNIHHIDGAQERHTRANPGLCSSPYQPIRSLEYIISTSPPHALLCSTLNHLRLSKSWLHWASIFFVIKSHFFSNGSGYVSRSHFPRTKFKPKKF